MALHKLFVQYCVQRMDRSFGMAENCALLNYYATSSGNFLQTFRDNLSVPSLRVTNPKITQILFLSTLLW